MSWSQETDEQQAGPHGQILQDEGNSRRENKLSSMQITGKKPHLCHSWTQGDPPDCMWAERLPEGTREGPPPHSRWCQSTHRLLRWNPSRLRYVHMYIWVDPEIHQIQTPNQAKQDAGQRKPGRNAPYKWFKLPRGHNPWSLPVSAYSHILFFFLLINTSLVSPVTSLQAFLSERL